MGDTLEPQHPALRQARQIANAMVPRTSEQSDLRQEITGRIFDVMMRMKEPETAYDTSALEGEAEALKQEAIALAKEMPRPGTVLLFDDCIPLRETEVVTDGEWRIALHEFDSLTIPSGTPLKVNSIGMFMVILSFPNGLVLRLRKENFPIDGIPIKDFPSATSVESE